MLHNGVDVLLGCSRAREANRNHERCLACSLVIDPQSISPFWIDHSQRIVSYIGVGIPGLGKRRIRAVAFGIDAEEAAHGSGVVAGEEVVQIGLLVAFLAGEAVAAVEAAGEAGIGVAGAEGIGDFLAEGGVIVAVGVALVLLGDEAGGAEMVGGAVEGAGRGRGGGGVFGGQLAEGVVDVGFGGGGRGLLDAAAFGAVLIAGGGAAEGIAFEAVVGVVGERFAQAGRGQVAGVVVAGAGERQAVGGGC